jgi:diguanylate cyclase (GGDEF)-like protein
MSRVVFLPVRQPAPAAPIVAAAPAPAAAPPRPPRIAPHLSWRLRVGALAVVALAMLVFLGTLGNSALDGYRQANAWARHGSLVKERVQLTFSQLKQAESAGRGFVLLGDPALDARFLLASEEVERSAGLLQRMVEKDPEQARNAAMLARLLSERLGQLDAVKSAYQHGSIASAQKQIAANLSLPQAAAIDALVLRMTSHEDQLLAERNARADVAEQRLRLFGPLVMAMGSMLLVFTVFAVLREQARRARAELRLQASQRELEISLDEARSSAHHLAQLGELGDLLQGCRSIEEAMAVLRAVASRLLAIDAGDVYLGHDDAGDFARIGGWGATAMPPRNCIARRDCWAVRRGQLFPAGDSTGGVCCPHVDAGDGRHHSCVPLSAQGESLGVLVIEHARPLTSVQRRLLRSVAEQLSLALANLRLQESLRSQSIRDALTGLYNRRYLDASLAREVARAARREQELSLLIVDIDHFKRINDTYGHEAGDTVLAQIATVLDLATRAEDIACRYGGEEFVVLMPGADAKVAQRRAEELRAAIERCDASYAGRSVGPVTVSVGVATFPAEGCDAAQLRLCADQALYAAKRGGRNRVEIATAA